MQNHIINNSGNLINKLINPKVLLNKEEETQNFNQNNNQNLIPYLGTRNVRQNKIDNFQTGFNNLNTVSNPNIGNYYDESVSSQKPIPPFLEDPVFIVTKNLFNSGWLLMNQQNKILASFNSLELLGFLEEEVKTGNNLREFCLSDHQTDMYFNPMQLYEILKESIPRIMETVKKQRGPINKGYDQQISNNFNNSNFSNNNLNNFGQRGQGNFSKNPNQYGNKFDISGVTFDTTLNSDLPSRNFTENNKFKQNYNAYSENNLNSNFRNNMNMGVNRQDSDRTNNTLNQQPLNMNINMHFIKNDINLNNFNVENKDPSKSSKDVINDLNNVGINASQIPVSQDYSNINYSELFNTSLSSDFKKSKK
jgi:hypothetical protein